DASRQVARDERSGCESLEDVRQVGPPVETLDDTFVCTVREPFAQHRLDEQTLEPRGETLDIPGACEQGGLSICHPLRDTGDGRRDDRQPVRHRLEKDVRDAVSIAVLELAAGQREDVCSRVLAYDLRLAEWTEEGDPVIQPELVHESLQARPLCSLTGDPKPKCVPAVADLSGCA